LKDQPKDKKGNVTAADEWIYGPVWPVDYHMNPSNAAVEYDKYTPGFNVLEPDVVYYNTRATASSLNITSPLKYEYYGEDVDVFKSNTNGVLTVGLKIEHPNLLAPWPTDETINPNGNTDSNVSWPEDAVTGDGVAGPPGAFTSPKNVAGETYTASDPEGYGMWYGFAKYKYNKNNTDNTIALTMKHNEGTKETVTSDYALIVPTRVQLEGLIWDKKPMYIEPDIPGYNYGPNKTAPGTRIGDEEGWATDEKGTCFEKRIHVWDSPEEALADPDGAALELMCEDAAGIDLKPYIGVHVL
jgi:hypothetical protein